MRNSMKQLIRTPVKLLIFFLLLALCTLLLVFSSSLMAETNQRIEAIEKDFTTLGSVEQPPISSKITVKHNECLGDVTKTLDIYSEIVPIDMLNFEGANYLTPPENRPTYFAYLPEMNHASIATSRGLHVFVFVPKESRNTFDPVEAEVVKVLNTNFGYSSVDGAKVTEGQTITICRCGGADEDGRYSPMEAGKQYVGAFFMYTCSVHGGAEYMLRDAPSSTQYDRDGNEFVSDRFPENPRRVEEVTENFWEPGGSGEAWLAWANLQSEQEHLFCVKPTSGLQMLPLFQEHREQIIEGRQITQEEFETGAQVCMVSRPLAGKNLLKIGDRIPLSLLYSLYGCNQNEYQWMEFEFTPFDAKGNTYQYFWEADYEIVGIYDAYNTAESYNQGELPSEMFIIPEKSVGASDENNIVYFNPMYRFDSTFQIPNGTIAEFDQALRAAVPEVSELEITYQDNGYSEIAESLNSVRTSAIFLLVLGIFATVTVLLLLLYFFVVKQKKRTAIERSLGMSKHQCRVSLISALAVMTIIASVVGSISASFLLTTANPLNRPENRNVAETSVTGETDEETLLQQSDITVFRMDFSSWSPNQTQVDFDETAFMPIYLFILPAAFIVLFVILFSILLVNRNLKIEPIYLLTEKME